MRDSPAATDAGRAVGKTIGVVGTLTLRLKYLKSDSGTMYCPGPQPYDNCHVDSSPESHNFSPSLYLT
ncbi:hypothetical protein PGTUg99_011729 [Puccinia graminis f. sp. tritici]|uniref:Uncharacterized protein n=1 Tax=Puccinia graminis f. sp. tritici TaxID=56615 RepID=A0A5B0RWG0_PUCGR|nr:hypothetical protein PGTUg99_011729 [Puccinia graminis f. sp. tritici]